jgi:Lar family restriction alleviation protein
VSGAKTTPALKPCPFCNGEPRFERIGTPRLSCIVACLDCGASLESNEVGERSGTNWNSRACNSALVAALDECATRFERCCVHSGSDKEFAAHAVEDYRALVKAAKGEA